MICKPYGLCYWKQKSKPVDGKNVLKIINQHVSDFVSGAQDIYFAVASRWPHCGSVEVHLPPLLVGRSSWCAQKSNKTGPKAEEYII